MYEQHRRPKRVPVVRALLGMAENAWLKRQFTRFAAFMGCGMPPLGWWRILKANDFRVNFRYWHLVLFGWGASIINAVNARRERRLYGAAVKRTVVQPPIIILGHWRSGTTMLHEMLSLDERFASPTFFQVIRPRTYLTEEPLILDFLKAICPDTRPMDNMTQGLDDPAEDEWALTMLTRLSPHYGFFFPRHAERHDRYLDLRQVSQSEMDLWKRGMVDCLQKLSYRYGKRMVLKSPTHTGRIQQLLELYPEAKFVHIHRNPYHVFRSSKRLYETGVSLLHLQRVPETMVLEGVFKRYRVMYDAFFECRDLIPDGQFCEVGFEELERDKLGQMERIYAELGLGQFEAVRSGLEAFVEARSGYRKNTYPPLPEEIRQRIAHEWGRCFEEWGYAR